MLRIIIAVLWLHPAPDANHLHRGFCADGEAAALGDAHRHFAGAARDIEHATAGHLGRQVDHGVFDALDRVQTESRVVPA